MTSEPRAEGVRAFVAVVVPPETRAQVAAVQQRLRGASGVKWVEPDNFHFTLRFLGQVTPEALQALQEALRAPVEQEEAFELTLSGVGAFPSVRRPKTVWMDVTQAAGRLEQLAAVVERVTVAQGFPPEPRPFRAHLTLGRVKAERTPEELVRALEAEAAPGEAYRMRVEEVVLMRSELRRTGPVYTPLAHYPLRQVAQG